MMRAPHTVRTSLLSRGMKALIALILLMGAAMLYLLSNASSNTPMFARNLPLLLLIGVALVLGLMMLVGYQLLALRRRLAAGLFGSKLTLRLVLLFSLVAVLPGALVYGVSVEFLNKSIESWFDVRVDKALEGALNLGRATLDKMLKELSAKATTMAASWQMRRQPRANRSAEYFARGAGHRGSRSAEPRGSIIAVSAAIGSALMPDPSCRRIWRSSSIAATSVIWRDRIRRRRRTAARVVLSPSDSLTDAKQAYCNWCSRCRCSSRATPKPCRACIRTTKSCAAAPAAQALVRPRADLGFAACAVDRIGAGDRVRANACRRPCRFWPPARARSRKATSVNSIRCAQHDELGVLTESFNTMTTQLAEARTQVFRNQEQVEAAKAYLETILAKLSAGVLSFDGELPLALGESQRRRDPGTSSLVGVDRLAGRRVECCGTCVLLELAAASSQRIDDGGSDLGKANRVRDKTGQEMLLLRGIGLASAAAIADLWSFSTTSPVCYRRSATPRGAKLRGAWRTRSRIR